MLISYLGWIGGLTIKRNALNCYIDATENKTSYSMPARLELYFHGWGGSQSKYKCSIIQTEQNTTKRNKIQHDKIQKFPRYKIQMKQNTNGTKYK